MMELYEHYHTYEEAKASAEKHAASGYNVDLFIYESETWPWREVYVCYDVVFKEQTKDGSPGHIEEVDNR